jgi:hypothetical protein
MAKVDNKATPVGAPLTDVEIGWQDALTLDLIANDKAFELAINNYRNTTARLYKKRADMWKQLLAVRGIDNEETETMHTIRSVRGQMCIVVMPKEDVEALRKRDDFFSDIKGE